MKNFHIIFILLLGFYLMPSHVFACGNKSEKHSSKTEMSSKTEKKDCCESSSESKNKRHNSCGGKCKHSKCICAASCSGFSAFFAVSLKFNRYVFSNEKQKFYSSETFISSGFSSLWLIPKIG
ncbi:hypothetical protein DMB65_10055 [Flavobacterium cheongpyeongense]|uniref:Uncharacterized protein n=1 Tax=Flavobacterium cheongpyeongense TaxID=2212651 RepID=A0A2V4BPV8_9FLAO|nr:MULTISPECIES: hypothetical protein [Flavobacterium]MBF4491549.1 hypothetical protein [Flavobacterium sp. MR2016-29]PXY40911.1 hypothetical protein DMB65_10055 [Flavobacterium cheongpyeongense]